MVEAVGSQSCRSAPQAEHLAAPHRVKGLGLGWLTHKERKRVGDMSVRRIAQAELHGAVPGAKRGSVIDSQGPPGHERGPCEGAIIAEQSRRCVCGQNGAVRLSTPRRPHCCDGVECSRGPERLRVVGCNGWVSPWATDQGSVSNMASPAGGEGVRGRGHDIIWQGLWPTRHIEPRPNRKQSVSEHSRDGAVTGGADVEQEIAAKGDRLHRSAHKVNRIPSANARPTHLDELREQRSPQGGTRCSQRCGGSPRGGVACLRILPPAGVRAGMVFRAAAGSLRNSSHL